MQIPTIQNGFQCKFETKFEPLERFEAIEGIFKLFKRDSNHSNANSNHSKGILTIRNQIQIIWTRFEAY